MKMQNNYWLDLYDSVPEDKAPLFMMVEDDNGERYYSIAARDGEHICHQTIGGDFGTFRISDVRGSEHIYYYYCNDIKIPQT